MSEQNPTKKPISDLSELYRSCDLVEAELQRMRDYLATWCTNRHIDQYSKYMSASDVLKLVHQIRRIRIPGADSDNELIPAIDTYNSRKAKEDPSWKLSQP